jgi:hypothetical protein
VSLVDIGREALDAQYRAQQAMHDLVVCYAIGAQNRGLWATHCLLVYAACQGTYGFEDALDCALGTMR